jgi:putative membrane protein
MVVLNSLFGGWYVEPVPLLAAAFAALLYHRGAQRLAELGPPPTRAQQACLWAGMAVILVAVLSPLDGLALRLQWAHMVQHVLLLVVAPPLVVLARPWETGLVALPPRWRAFASTPQRLVISHRRRLLAAAASVITFIGVMWMWHVPGLYNLTLRDEVVHNVEHTVFLAVGLLFWNAALPKAAGVPAIGLVARSVVVLGGLVGSWLLAVYIGYAPSVLYAYPGSGSLTALADQQLASGIMWVPASVPFIAAVVWIMARWFENDARLAASEAGLRGKAPA